MSGTEKRGKVAVREEGDVMGYDANKEMVTGEWERVESDLREKKDVRALNVGDNCVRGEGVVWKGGIH